MFIGEHTRSLDSKGRVPVPSEIRDPLRAHFGETMVVTRGLYGKCLWAFPLRTWEELVGPLMGGVGIPTRQEVDQQRWLLPRAVQCKVDKSGRILLAPGLREYAQIDKDVTFVGLGKRIELWKPGLWARTVDGLDGEKGAEAPPNQLEDATL